MMCLGSKMDVSYKRPFKRGNECTIPTYCFACQVWLRTAKFYGAGTVERIFRMTVSGEISSASAWYESNSLWRRMAGATALISSGITKCLDRKNACACAAC